MKSAATNMKWVCPSLSLNSSSALPASSYSVNKTGLPTISLIACWSSSGRSSKNPFGIVVSTTISPGFGFMREVYTSPLAGAVNSRFVAKPDKFLPVLHMDDYRVYQALSLILVLPATGTQVRRSDGCRSHYHQFEDETE